ncbi:hypothetical protein [Clostridium akagii]|uniref:hypothetical protein n=1 Tax=Clostridium akagii TaxID=91623 RepID=UPI00047D3A13|nr:hypothetical protein [Clostridium akagii]
MLSFKLFNTLKDIINNAYPESEYPDNKFKKFYLDVIPKEMKSIHGRYYSQSKKIEVFNLSRPTGHIVSTTIHEASHHIDHCLRHASDHTKAFYEVMHNMLITAMGMGIITTNDILTANDSKDKERLIKYFGDIESWEIRNIDYKQAIVTFKITNCFSIKDCLKEREYKYSGEEQCWIKDINKTEQEAETLFLSEIIDMNNVKIVEGNEIDIEAVYYICVLNSYECKDFLKENGYLWNGYKIKKNSWTKKILAKNKDKELDKISSLQSKGVKIQLVSKKLIHK